MRTTTSRVLVVCVVLLPAGRRRHLTSPRRRPLLLDPQDWPARRTSYRRYDVWVTPYVASERYAAGEFVLASR